MSLRAESCLREQSSAEPAYALVGVELLALSAVSPDRERRADNAILESRARVEGGIVAMIADGDRGLRRATKPAQAGMSRRRLSQVTPRSKDGVRNGDGRTVVVSYLAGTHFHQENLPALRVE